MDHKIQIQKKNPWIGWIIALLVILLAALIGFYVFMSISQKQALTMAQNLAKNLEVITTKVKEGPFDLKISNITGSVRSEQSVDLYWQTSGTVSEINYEIGNFVRKDEVIALLDEKTLDQDVLNAQLDIEDARDDYDDLVKNTENISSALSTLVTAQQTLEDAQESLDSMDMSRVTDVYLTIVRDAATVAELNYQDALKKFDSVKDAPLDSEGRQKALGDIGGYRSLRDNALAEYNKYMGEVDQLELQTREAKVELSKAELEEAQYQYDKAVKGPTEAQLTQAQSKIDAFQKKIDSSKIIAPFDGTITRIDAKIGDVITYDSASSARNVFAVRMDDLSTFYIDFTVSELYINSIRKGQPVSISFAAIPNKVYSGTVDTVSDVGIQDGWNVSFDVTVSLDDPDENIRSGMTADVNILVDHVDNAIYVPKSAILSKNGHYYVNLKNENGNMVETEVTVGLVSGNNVQILSDIIHGGDEIELDVNQRTDSGMNFMFGGMNPGGGWSMGGPAGGPPPGGPIGGPGGF